MAKSLNDVLKGVNKSKVAPGSTGDDPGIDYAGKMKDERDFVAKHKTEKHEDRVGNGDEVYMGATKKAKMERHGHDPDPKAKTVYKQYNEAKDTREYGYEGEMAISQIKSIMNHSEQLMKMLKPDTDMPEWVQSKITLASDYIQTAADYFATQTNEETIKESTSKRMCEACGKSGSSCSCNSDKDDQLKYNGKKKLLLDRKKLQEVLTKKTSSGEIISDFIHSKDPKFAGKSKAERQKMALGAYYGMHPEKSRKSTNEEVEQIDEVGDTAKGRDMLRSYMNKAETSRMDAIKNASPTGVIMSADESNKRSKEARKISNKRITGIQRAYAALDKASGGHESKFSRRTGGRYNEEVENLEEAGMPASVIKHKQALADLSDKEFAQKHGDKSEKELRDMAARHGYGFNKATKTGSDHYVNRVARGKNAMNKKMENEQADTHITTPSTIPGDAGRV